MHIMYVIKLTVREQPESPLRLQWGLHSFSGVPRARTMHPWAHESIWLLPNFGSLQHIQPLDSQNALQFDSWAVGAAVGAAVGVAVGAAVGAAVGVTGTGVIGTAVGVDVGPHESCVTGDVSIENMTSKPLLTTYASALVTMTEVTFNNFTSVPSMLGAFQLNTSVPTGGLSELPHSTASSPETRDRTLTIS